MTTSPNDPASFADALQEMQRQFAAALPDRIETLQAQYRALNLADWRVADAQTLHQQLHALTGSAGTFGMESLSAAARQLEIRLEAIVASGMAPDEATWQAIGAELVRLKQLAHSRLRAGTPGLTPPPATPRLDRSPRVDLVEDDREQAERLAQSLVQAGYQVRVFTALADFRAAWGAAGAAGETPDAVVLDVVFPEGEDAGIELLAELKASRASCPPVVFTSVRDDLDARLAAYRAGASRYLLKPIEPAALIDLLDALTGRMPPQPYRVLLVDDDPLLLQTQAAVLRAAGMEVHTLTQPRETLAVLDAFRPDVLVLDVYMPEVSGPELAAVVREREDYLHLPILFLSAETDPSQQLLALNLGGDDFLVKPVQANHLVQAVTARARRARQHTALQRRLQTILYEREREHLAVDAHAIVSIADAAGTITYVNDKFCAVSGYTRGELIGQNHRIIKSGLHPPEFYREMWQTIASGQIWHGEVCNRRKDGRLYWVASTIVPFLDADGLPYQYVSIRTDITRIKEQEEALRVRDERLRRSQIYANIGTWDWNIVTGELYWSERIAPLFGYPEGELETTYENFLQAVHPDDRQAVIDAVNACVERDVPYEIEHRVVWPDGQVRWLLERGAVTRDADGRPLRMLGVVQDIDARKRAELALAESERRFALAVEGPGDGVWDWDIPSGTLKLSANYEGMLGYAKGEIPETIDAWAASVHPEDMPGVKAALDDYLAGRRDTYAVELRLRCKDGSYKWILGRGSVVERDARGSPKRMIGIHTDISARKAMEAELVAAREAAEAANRAKSEFLSSMSHELRTPLNAIIGFAQILETDEKLSADQQDNVHEILKAGRHLLELINEVLDLAKIEAGRIDLSMEGVELPDLAQECVQLVAPLAARRGIAVDIAVDAGQMVFADRHRLRQVLLNLLSNAIKYNHEGGRVTLAARASSGDRVRIEVRDTGPGIPAEKLPLLFKPFSRLGKEASNIEGTGIGLTIVRRLVELMGGTVGVESAPGEGSTFWVELAAAAPAEKVGAGVTAVGLTPACGEVATVLAIDDNPTNLKLLTQMLGRLCPQLHLITAHNAELGLELALAQRPDLILLDISMPGMNGLELLSVMKAHDRLKTIPVIAVTAHAMPHDIERARAAGFADYLTKPLDLETLRASLKRHLLTTKESA
jgi:PAS domain S-box-containing protein